MHVWVKPCANGTAAHRCKKWGSKCLVPDEVLAELMKQNQTLEQVFKTPRPPGGYVTNTPEDEEEVRSSIGGFRF